MMSRHLPNIANLKAEARRYRASKVVQGTPVTHSRALELVARRHGFYDWNTAAAHANSLPTPRGISAGSHVSGRYLGHEFSARVVASTTVSEDRVLVSLDLWEPIDVIASNRFSSFRKRVVGTIDSDGRSEERLSCGTPQLEIFLERGDAR